MDSAEATRLQAEDLEHKLALAEQSISKYKAKIERNAERTKRDREFQARAAEFCTELHVEAAGYVEKAKRLCTMVQNITAAMPKERITAERIAAFLEAWESQAQVCLRQKGVDVAPGANVKRESPIVIMPRQTGERVALSCDAEATLSFPFLVSMLRMWNMGEFEAVPLRAWLEAGVAPGTKASGARFVGAPKFVWVHNDVGCDELRFDYSDLRFPEVVMHKGVCSSKYSLVQNVCFRVALQLAVDDSVWSERMASLGLPGRKQPLVRSPKFYVVSGKARRRCSQAAASEPLVSPSATPLQSPSATPPAALSTHPPPPPPSPDSASWPGRGAEVV